MPQPQSAPGPRGNSAMAQFKPKRWQVEDRCGICSTSFSLLTTRHHCRHCGLSVCGKHSKNKVIVPSSLSKVPQRVCDRCYPKCRNVTRGLAPPPATPRDLPDDKPRRHTLEANVDREFGRRPKSPREGPRRTLEAARRDNRTWNGDDDYEGPKRQLRGDVRERRMRSPRAKSPHAARSPHGRERPSRDKRPSRDRELHPSDLMGGTDPRDRERRRRDPREMEARRREKEPRERREPREREREPRDRREPRGQEPRDRREPPREREKEHRDRREPPRELERRDRALHERDLFDDRPPPIQKERRRIPSTDPSRNRKREQMRSPAPSLDKRLSSKQRRETTSTCRTTSSTLSNLYAGLNAYEDLNVPPQRPPPRQKKKEKVKETPSAFADSTFSIFSLAGSDHSDSETKENVRAVEKKKAARRPGKDRTDSTHRTSMEKKEHLDFSASSSSVKSFEVSAITQKYLNPPKPAKAAMQKKSLQPMIEEDSEGEESVRGPSKRKARPAGTNERRRDAVPSNQRRHENKVRGQHPSSGKMIPPFRRAKPVDVSFRDTRELLREGMQSDALSKGRKPSAQNSGAKSTHKSSISDDDGFKDSLSSDNCFSDDEDEGIARLIAASNRGKQDHEAKLRAKKRAIAGIDSASLAAKEKACTTAKYQLTKRDQEFMRQISELEAIVLQHQKELPDLLDMYSEATKRATKAQMELQKAKARVARYEKAHAAVSRAIRSGRLYMKQKEYMAAILELSRATGIERSNATLWYMLAECRLEVSQPAAAEEACMTSLRLQPTAAGVALLGRILHERGRDDEAIECYLSALGRNEESEDEDE